MAVAVERSDDRMLVVTGDDDGVLRLIKFRAGGSTVASVVHEGASVVTVGVLASAGRAPKLNLAREAAACGKRGHGYSTREVNSGCRRWQSVRARLGQAGPTPSTMLVDASPPPPPSNRRAGPRPALFRSPMCVAV